MAQDRRRTVALGCRVWERPAYGRPPRDVREDLGTMTKQELIAKLRTNADDATTKLRAIPDEAWQQGRYENGWNARQILAHVASIEWTYPRLIDLAKQTPGQPPADNAQQKPTLDPLLLVAGLVAGVATLCLLLIGSRSAAS